MKGNSSGLVEGLTIRHIGDTTRAQDLFQRWLLHFGVIRDGDKLSRGTDQNDVLAVLPAFEPEFPFQHFPALLPGSQRQLRQGHELRSDLEPWADQESSGPSYGCLRQRNRFIGRRLIADRRFEEHIHVRLERIRNIRLRFLKRRALGNTARKFDDMHRKPAALLVALEFQVEGEIVAGNEPFNEHDSGSHIPRNGVNRVGELETACRGGNALNRLPVPVIRAALSSPSAACGGVTSIAGIELLPHEGASGE